MCVLKPCKYSWVITPSPPSAAAAQAKVQSSGENQNYRKYVHGSIRTNKGTGMSGMYLYMYMYTLQHSNIHTYIHTYIRP